MQHKETSTMTMTIARWTITVQPLTAPTTAASTTSTPLARATRYLTREHRYTQQRTEVDRWLQLHGGR
jgi:hypothetical protein